MAVLVSTSASRLSRFYSLLSVGHRSTSVHKLKELLRTGRTWAIKVALKVQKFREQLCAMFDQNGVQRCCGLVDIGLFDLYCIAVCSGLCRGAWRYTVGLHHLVFQLFQFHRIAALVINTVPAPFPFPTACQPRMQCQQGKLQDGIS